MIFGHAKDANLHFMITPRLGVRAEVETYARFTDDLVDLVLSNEGSLKAEHGTGRIMAPFVRRQYGDALYQVMVDLKDLCDPLRILNRGVLLDEDPIAHLRNFKPAPLVDPDLAFLHPVPADVACNTQVQRILKGCEPVAKQTRLVPDRQSQVGAEPVVAGEGRASGQQNPDPLSRFRKVDRVHVCLNPEPCPSDWALPGPVGEDVSDDSFGLLE